VKAEGNDIIDNTENFDPLYRPGNEGDTEEVKENGTNRNGSLIVCHSGGLWDKYMLPSAMQVSSFFLLIRYVRFYDYQ